MLIVQGNEENPFFITDKYINKRYEYRFTIFWNTETIGGQDCNGYIVQKVEANSGITGVVVEELPYFEAWKVCGGDTGNQDYDDSFDCWYVENEGVVTYRSEVYWISSDDELYADVDKWEKGKVRMANQLPSSYKFPGIMNRSPLFGRQYVYDNRGMNYENNN
jgi:hypothetical protein